MSVHENSQPNLVSANKLTFASRLPESMLQHGDDRWVSAEPVVPADPKVVEVGDECAPSLFGEAWSRVQSGWLVDLVSLVLAQAVSWVALVTDQSLVAE